MKVSNMFKKMGAYSMKKEFILSITAASLFGCASSSPNYDLVFGDSVRNARNDMVIDQKAAEKSDTVAGIDGLAARESVIQYRDSFKRPPPVTNVINIGGRIGSGGR